MKWQADLENGFYKNPVLYADYSDPDAVCVGDDFFLVASSFCNVPGIPILHSKDLVNWELVNYALKKIPEFRYREPVHGCGVWAPAIRFHDGKYFICFPMPDEGIYMTTAENPYGDWSEPVNIRPGAGWIDPCPFWDDDGKAYLVSGVAKSRMGYKNVLHLTEMQPDGMALTGRPVRIYDGGLHHNPTTEGPKLYKRNGWYYIFAPAGGVKTGWQLILRSRNIYGPYEQRVVMKQGNTKINGPHQGAWVHTAAGEDWFLHFQDVFAAGRVMCLEPMRWGEDGWPVIGEAEMNETCGTPAETYRKPHTEKECRITVPATDDDFPEGKLGLQWQWNANPEENFAGPAGHEKGLRLNAVPAVPERPVCDYRNLLLQKWPAPEFTCRTELSVKNLKPGDRAGIVSMGTVYAALFAERTEEGFQIRRTSGRQIFDCGASYADGKTGTMMPGLAFSDGEQTLTFSYRVQRTGMTETVKSDDPEKVIPSHPEETVTLSVSADGQKELVSFSVPAEAGRWVGVKNGVFCEHIQEDRESNITNGPVQNASPAEEGQPSEPGYAVVRAVRYE